MATTAALTAAVSTTASASASYACPPRAQLHHRSKHGAVRGAHTRRLLSCCPESVPTLTSFASSYRRQSSGATRVQTSCQAAPSSSDRYDYIIVGGGAAGSVLANRLTASGDKKVLVLEAGPEDSDYRVKVPAAFTKIFLGEFDWNLFSENEAKVASRNVYLPRGRVLGGSSCTNATLYMRGAAADYEAWVEAGAEGWGPEDVLPWFKTAEGNSRGKSAVHNDSGPLKVSDPRYENVLVNRFFEAGQQAGMKRNYDFNDWGHGQEGFGPFQVTTDNGWRCSASQAYLKPARSRPNLTVVTSAHATRIVMERTGEAGPVARGVEYDGEGFKATAKLKEGGEVLLTAGAVHSPQLLMLSGIGPGAELTSLGLPILVDLPGVGKNMQDHPAIVLTHKVKDKDVSINRQIYLKDGVSIPNPAAVLNFLLRGRGPLTSTGCDHGAFVSTRPGELPDLQLRFVAALSMDPDALQAYAKWGKGEVKQWPDGFTFQLVAVRAKSRGSIHLRSANPHDKPVLRPNFLSNPDDSQTLRDGIRLARKLSETAALKGHSIGELYPGPQVQTDEQMDEYIAKTLHSANAIVGTCKMGSASDATAVVDTALRVQGVSGLRVIDSSVMPMLPGAQTGAPTIMIAERAAAMLNNPAGRASGVSAAKVPVAV
eukprot:jgi/Chlat1/7646/Chrsp64S07121